ISSVLGLLAAAPDRSSFFVELRAALPQLLPEVRVDLLAPGFGDEGPIVFTTGGLLPPPDIDNGADLALWLGRQGYRFTMTLPLVGAGQDCGWLALARWRSAFGPEARVLAGQLAPLIALRLRFDRSQDRVAICESTHSLIDQKLRETASLR